MEPRSKRDNESTTMDNPKLNSERGNEPTMKDKSKPEDSKGIMKLLQRTNPNKIKMDNDSTMMAKHSPKKQTGQWKTQFPLKGVLRVKGVLGPRARVKGSKLKLCTRARGPRTPFTPRTSFKGNCVEINNDGKTELLMKHTFVPSSSLPRGHDHSCHSRWSIPASSAMDEHLLLCWGDESDHRVAPGLGGSRLQISNLPPWYPGFLHIILPSRVSQYDVYLP